MGAWDHEEPLSHCCLAQALLVFDLGWRIRGEATPLEKDRHHWYTVAHYLDLAHILLAVAVRKQ